jgi:sec-independent protein translocase protein TatA
MSIEAPLRARLPLCAATDQQCGAQKSVVIGERGFDWRGLGHTWREAKTARRLAPRQSGENDMLNNIGLPGLLLIAVVVLVLFGRGKISSLMGEVGKGITAFKKGVKDTTTEIEDAGTQEARDVTPKADKDKV